MFCGIHRDYMELGSEIHIDMYDDRMEVYSPGGMFDGQFHVTMWNLNYAMDVIKDNPHVVKAPEDVVKDVVKETGDVVKAKANVTKEFVKAQRQIYKLISQTPQINATQMSENMGISLRQVQRYLKQLSNLKLIVREGGRKNGIWKILDEEYEGFFKRI